ncbi:MAG: hypothetical protein HYU78_15175 [Rhodocyclales bacterium]|nr:hypothetical protein [Rhodocyclales bacterium]
MSRRVTDAQNPARGILRLCWALLFYGLATWFILQFLTTNLSYELLRRLMSPAAILTVTAWLFTRHFMMLTWRSLLENAARGNSTMVASVYAKSLLGRYIPGKIFMFAARGTASRQLGLSLPQILSTSVAEAILALLAAATVGSVLILLSGTLGATPQVIGALSLPIMLGTVVFRLADPLRLLQIVSGRGPRCDWFLGWSRQVTVLALRRACLFALAAQLLSGAGFLAWALTAPVMISWSDGLRVAGSFPLAGVVGVLALTPAGIGFREAAQLPLIGKLFDNEEFALLIVGARLLELVADLGFLVLCRLTQTTKQTNG